MKNVLLFFICGILLIFCMPIIFTNNFNTEEVSTELLEENISESFDYGEYTRIKLLHTNDGKIEELNLDEYLYGVVAAEMPASYEIEALKSQAVVARTYTIYKIQNETKHENADICDSSLCCQAWISKENRLARWEKDEQENLWNKIVSAVNETKGKIILFQNEPINAFFHSNSGGKTENPINVWGGNYPYLQSVETSGEQEYSTYKSEVILSKDELISKMLTKYSNFTIDFEKVDPIKILEYTEGDRIKKIKIGNVEISGVEARNIFELKSAKFEIKIENDDIYFYVVGYGHGVGMSQSGSDALAKKGKKYEEIIKYYYKDVEVSE